MNKTMYLIHSITILVIIILSVLSTLFFKHGQVTFFGLSIIAYIFINLLNTWMNVSTIMKSLRTNLLVILVNAVTLTIIVFCASVWYWFTNQDLGGLGASVVLLAFSPIAIPVASLGFYFMIAILSFLIECVELLIKDKLQGGIKIA